MNQPIQTTTGRYVLTDLPNEVLLATFLRLDLNSLLAVCQINQQMQLFCQDDFLWKQKFIQDFGSAPNLQEGEKWKDIYKATFLLGPNSPISVGDRHYGVIDENGLLYMMGDNSLSQLGFISDLAIVKTPTLIQLGSAGTKVISVSCSGNSTVVVTNDGLVYGAGEVDFNLDGKTQIVKTLQNFKRMNIPEKVQKVSHSGNHYLFLLENKSVLMSGSFLTNLSGVYKSESENIHVSKIVDIKAIDIAVMSGTIRKRRGRGYNIYHVTKYAIIDNDHNLHYWGNWFGPTDRQITKDLRHKPLRRGSELHKTIHYRGLTYDDYSHQITIEPIRISLPEKVKQVALGMNHILILSLPGNVYVMGYNRNGQLGTDNHTYPFQETPMKLTLPTKISSVSAGKYSSIAITKNGKLYIWGRSSDVIPDLKNQEEILERLPHRKDADFGLIILKPIIINLDIPGDSHSDDVNADKYKIVYISVGPFFGMAVTKDRQLDLFGTDYIIARLLK